MTILSNNEFIQMDLFPAVEIERSDWPILLEKVVSYRITYLALL